MAIESTYRVLQLAANAEVQRLWDESRNRGETAPRRAARRRPGRTATVEALEPRQMLSVSASVTGASHVTEGQAYVLNLSGAATGTPNGWTIKWGDSSTTTAGPTAASSSHTYVPDAQYTITATFSDTENNTAQCSTSQMTVVVDEANGSGQAGISASAAVTEGSASPYTLYPSFTDPGGESASTWAVYWGDSTASTTYAGSSSALSHSYSEPGTYAVTLVAYDSDYTGGPVSLAGTYSSSTTVTVSEAVPSVGVTGAGTVTAGSTYELSNSFSDPGNDSVTGWAVWWGDSANSTTYPSTQTSFTHIYPQQASTYAITVVAYDEDFPSGSYGCAGAYSTTASVTVTVQGGGGNAAAVVEGSVYTLRPSFTDPSAVTGTQPVTHASRAADVQQGPDSASNLWADYPRQNSSETSRSLKWTMSARHERGIASPDPTGQRIGQCIH